MEFQKREIIGSKLRRLQKKRQIEFKERAPEDGQKKALANAFKYFPDLSGLEKLPETKIRTANLEEIYASKPGFIHLNPVILAGTMAYLIRNDSFLEFKLDLNRDFTVDKLSNIINIILTVNKIITPDEILISSIAATILRYVKWIFKL